MKLGVVIVTYNRLNLLKECIGACLSQTVKFSDVFVIDNASSDGTADYLNAIKDNNVHVISSKINLGGAGGFHLGVKEAIRYDLDYLLLIDDDAILDKKYNEYVLPYMLDGNNNMLAFSGTVRTDSKIQFSHRRHMRGQFRCKNSSIDEYSGSYFDYELATFCGLYISVNTIKKIGLPQKDFFIWFDDTEYSIRILKYSKIRNINKARINHKAVVESTRGYSWKSYYSVRNQTYIMKKYFSRMALCRYAVSIYVHVVYSWLQRIIKHDKYYSNVAIMYSEALSDGIRGKLGKNNKYLASNSKLFERKKVV